MLWDIKASIRSFTFDTTATNMGCKKGSCTRMMHWLDRPVLWFGCRHHMLELCAKACWYALFNDDLKPTVPFFNSIKSSWDHLDTNPNAPITVLDGDIFNREAALKFYREVLTKKNRRNKLIVQDDYREAVETSMILLGEDPVSGQSWKKPGPTHKARFLAYSIYINKAMAFSKQIEEAGTCMDFLPMLNRIAVFNTTLYVPYFVSASMGSGGPFNDLELFHKLIIFSETDPVVGKAALDVLARHT